MLAKSHVGCYMNKVFINHLFYADDSVLIASSPAALQILINICQAYARNNDIVYNSKKTICMSFKPKCLKNLHVPTIYLNESPLKWVTNQKYLGVYFSDNVTDDRDITRELRALYAQGNIILRKFGKCSLQVKIQLFKSYCSNMYCCPL